jgi:hypothetical protein
MKSYKHIKDPKLLKRWNSYASRMITQLLEWLHICASRTMAQQHICGDDEALAMKIHHEIWTRMHNINKLWTIGRALIIWRSFWMAVTLLVLKILFTWLGISYVWIRVMNEVN